MPEFVTGTILPFKSYCYSLLQVAVTSYFSFREGPCYALHGAIPSREADLSARGGGQSFSTCRDAVARSKAVFTSSAGICYREAGQV